MRNDEIADQHFVRGQQLMTAADALTVNAPTDPASMQRACTLAAVAQGHFHAAMAATTMGTQRGLIALASGDVQAVTEQAAPNTRPKATFRDELNIVMKRYGDHWPAEADCDIESVRGYAGYMRGAAADPEWPNLSAADREKNLAQAAEMEAFADRASLSTAPSLSSEVRDA